MSDTQTQDENTINHSVGAIYIATGKVNYLKESIFSAHSLKRHNSDLAITLFTNHSSIKEDCFDQVIPIKDEMNPFKIKVKYMLESPYDRTLFLDSDTKIKSSVMELFQLLDQCDLALSSFPEIDRSSWPSKILSYEKENKFNTGVILYKRIESTLNFFNEWLKRVLREEARMSAYRVSDQTHFNQLIAENIHHACGVKLLKISNKIYNVRPPMIIPMAMSREINHAKIIHCHNLHRNLVDRQLRRVVTKLTRN